MERGINVLCKKFGLPERVILKLASLVNNGEIIPTDSYPKTNNAEVLKRYAFVKDYYDYITANNMI